MIEHPAAFTFTVSPVAVGIYYCFKTFWYSKNAKNLLIVRVLEHEQSVCDCILYHVILYVFVPICLLFESQKIHNICHIFTAF